MWVYPPILFILFARGLAGTVQTDFIINLICKSLMKSKSLCEILHENATSDKAFELQKIVQPHVSHLLMIKSFIDSIIPAFISLFLGSWSDVHGRKPLLIAGYSGLTIMYSVLICLSMNDVTNQWYVLMAFVPAALLGGFCTLIMATFCYVTDITDNNDRSWHLVCLEATMSIGNLIGIFMGPLVFNKFGYIAVFAVTVLFCLLGLIYVLIIIPETNSRNLTEWKLFNGSNFKSLFVTIFKKRKQFDRCIIWCCVAILTLNVLIIEGEFQVGFLFVGAKLGWNVQDFSYWLGFNVIAGIFGTLIGGHLMGRILRTSDIMVAILANFSPLNGSIAKAFTFTPWHMYLAIILGMFGDVTRPMIRTQLSKSAPSQDVGKLFSLTMFFETLIPFAAGPLYSVVYAYTMPPMYPSPVWFVSTTLYSIMIILAIVIRQKLIK